MSTTPLEPTIDQSPSAKNKTLRRWPLWPIAAVIFAVICGSLAFWGTQRYLANNASAIERELSERFRNVEIVVAAKALAAGQKILATDLAKRALPQAMTSANSLVVDELDQIIGRRLLVALATGEPLSKAALVQEEVRSLAARLQPGARAVTVPVDDITSQAGLVRPGDRVDLMLAEEHTDQGIRCVQVTPLIEAVMVLATGQAQGDAESGADEMRRGEDYELSHYSTLTLDVTPERAQQIAAALRIGELIPVLRGEGDLTVNDLPSLSAGLPECTRGTPSQPVKNNDLKATSQVELWVGGQVPPARSVHEFAASGTRISGDIPP